MTAFPVAPAMSFVEEEYQVIALYAQNELRLVEPGNPAEFTLQDVSRARHQGQGRFDRLGAGPGPGRAVGHAAADRRLSAGAGPLPGQARRSPSATASCSSPPARTAHGAIYTEHAHAIHILRMVILRVGTITDYLVLKLH